MSAAMLEADSDDLEALFDSIVRENKAPTPAATTPAVDQARDDGSSSAVMARVGHLTRMLHDALRELGYDRVLEKTAAAIPDARERLDYVVKMTEQAAVRSLTATETALPIQQRLGAHAERLSAQWQALFDKQLSVDEFKTLVADTRGYLEDVPRQTGATHKQLLEIMMAQDFQDLTGQVIKKIVALAQEMEKQLVQLLVDLVPAQRRGEINSSLLSGPVVNAEGRGDIVTSQGQVDDLLESLGF